MSKKLLGGLDIGTTGCKLSVYDTEGNYISNSYRSYDVSRVSGAHEMDASKIFGAVCGVISDTVSKYELEAVGVTSFGESFVAVGENDEVLFPTMLYTDPRGGEEVKELCDKLGEDFITNLVGVKPHSMFSLPKIMWLKKNFPDKFEKVKHILLIEDYVVYLLSGKTQIDYSLAARTMAFDIRKNIWAEDVFKAAGIDSKLLSTPVPAGTVAGELKKEICDKLGIKKPFLVVTGAHDQVASAVGAGCITAGCAVDGTGTVECVVPVFEGVPTEKKLYEGGYSVIPFINGLYVCYAVSFTGGATLKWYRDNFASDIADKDGAYKILDGGVKDKPTGILILPHFAGACNPYMDTGSKAAVIGLTLEHDKYDFYKALMEGVTYEMMTNVTCLEEAGIKIDRLYATGGGASSPVWLSIKADILNRPITSLDAKEVGACGTCMLESVALGYYPDLESAKKVFVHEKRTCLPNVDKTKEYKKLFGAYSKLYNAVRPLTEEL